MVEHVPQSRQFPFTFGEFSTKRQLLQSNSQVMSHKILHQNPTMWSSSLKYLLREENNEIAVVITLICNCFYQLYAI